MDKTIQELNLTNKRKLNLSQDEKGRFEVPTPALLPPKMDFVFKRIFGNEKHPNILISFLNAVLTPIDPIQSVELKDRALEKTHLTDKFGILDVLAITDKGEQINIEIQVEDEKNMIPRSLYYWSKLFESQLSQGDFYQKLSKTICINLVDFNLLDTPIYHSCYRIKECETNQELTELFELHFIELKKMKKINRISDIKDQLEAWIQFINHPESEIVFELSEDNEDIRVAKDELIRLSCDEETRLKYEKRVQSILDKNSALKSAEEKGIKQGIEQGAKQKEIEIAKNLLDVLDNETIALKTGLSILVVEELRKE